jgi:hypothetical protein
MTEEKVNLKPEEFDLVTVVCDLLEKGRPETRIAQQFHRANYTEKRLVKLLTKLRLSEDFQKLVLERFRILGQKNIEWYEHDTSQLLGRRLRTQIQYKR